MLGNYNDEYKRFENVVTAIEDNRYKEAGENFSYDARFFPLPEAYDVFQNIDIDKAIHINSNQKRFAKQCLSYMEKALKQRAATIGITKVLPKLYTVVEEDDALTIHWDYVNYRIYLDIEKDVSQSFYGIVFQKAANSVAYATDPLLESNYISVIDRLINFVFAN